MTARELRKLRPGVRVRLTASAIRMGHQGQAKTDRGTVLEAHPPTQTIRVRRNGLQTSEWYDRSLWAAVE